MTETIPPLPELEITDATKKIIDQHSVDRALQIIYKHCPDLFTRFAEREKENLGIEEFAPDFLALIQKEVRKEVDIPNPNLSAGRILLEACRRARLMYGMTLRPEINVRSGQ